MFFVQYRTVTHASIVLTLSGWTSEFPWDLGFAKSHPFQGIPFLSSSTWAPYQILDQSLTQIIFYFFTSEGAGTGLFLLMRSTQLVVIRGNRVCMAPSLYLDQHGEVSSKSLSFHFVLYDSC